MKYQRHYLSEDKGNNKLCPLQTLIQCDSHCAWFDHENQDCRQLGMMWKIRDDLHDIADELGGINLILKEGKDDKRAFKF